MRPFHSRFFWKLAFSYAVVVAVAAGCIGLLIERNIGLGAQHGELRRIVVIGTATAALAALAFGLLVARHITASIAEITRVARALSSGEHHARVRALPANDIGVLGEALNQLAREVALRLASLSEDQARLRAMLAGMVEGVVAVNAEDRVLFCNEAARRLLDPDNKGLGGERIWERVRISGLGEILHDAHAGEGLVRREISVTRDGRELVLDAHASPFRSAGAGGVVVVFHDTTELRRLERIRRDFVANVSHELKTPLTAIQGYVETLLAGALRDEANNERFLHKIDHHVRRLTYLVSDLLDLARIESQASLPVSQAVDLQLVLSEVAQRHEADILGRHHVFDLRRHSEPVVILGDREGLLQVADNLLDNAIKYTPEGGRIELRTGRADGQGFFEIEDTGIGIPEAELGRIFERFYRIDKAHSTMLGGTGLGLAIVKHLVSAMDGEVRVESTLGKGSTFRVLLPLVV